VRLIAETVADIMHKPRNLLRFGSIPHRTDEPLEIVGDNTRFVDATGWKPKTTLETGVELMVAALSGTDGNE
jgi:nucleoside-diphosphate-sugar epimerase